MLATTSLPPLLDGPKRGHLHMTIDLSQCTTLKPTSAALIWWGCQSSPDTVWFSSSAAQASITFALRSRAPYVFQYLHDAKHLQINIFDADGSSLGEAIVDLYSITPDHLQLTQLVDITTPHLSNINANLLKVDISIDFIDIDAITSIQQEDIPATAGGEGAPSSSSVEVVTSTLEKLKSQRQAQQQRLNSLHNNASTSNNEAAAIINAKVDTDMNTIDQPASSLVLDVSGIMTVNIQSLIHLSDNVSNSLLYMTATTTQSPITTTTCTTTQLVHVYHIPPVGYTAAFDTYLHLNIQCKDLLDRTTWPPGADGPMLLLNVWSRNHNDSKCIREVAVPLHTDALVGCAPADLHPLLMQHNNIDIDIMTQNTINIVNYMQQVVGHVRIGIEVDRHVAEAYHRHYHEDTSGDGDDVHMDDADDDDIEEDVVKAAASKDKNHWMDGNNTIDDNGGSTHHNKKKQEAEKVRYAWSGSDSDDGDGLLGIAYQGAVSPGFTDDDEDGEAERRRNERESSSKGREEKKPTRGGLIDDDWLFNIQKQPPPAMKTNDDKEEEEASRDGDGDSSIGINSEDEEPHQVVKFINKLPPAILRTTLNGAEDNNNNNNNMVVIPKYDGNAPAAMFIGVNSTMHGGAIKTGGGKSGKGAVAVTKPIIHGTSAAAGNNNSAAEDWLFGIGKSDQPGSCGGGGASSSRPASGYVDQFSPFQITATNNNNIRPSSGSGSALDTTTESSLRALTLDEVIENLKTQRQD